MAYRAGATLQDMEMVQFHPTTLYIAGASRALITEAVRGEGAYLVDRHGYRFMKDYHESGELAPRDVVSRAHRGTNSQNPFHACLSGCAAPLPSGEVQGAFLQLDKLLDEFDLDGSEDLIPVHPAAHYMIGGVGSWTSTTAAPVSRGSSQSGRQSAARACMGPTGWGVIHCSKAWPLAPARAGWRRVTPGKTTSISLKAPSRKFLLPSRRSWTSTM